MLRNIRKIEYYTFLLLAQYVLSPYACVFLTSRRPVNIAKQHAEHRMVT